MKREIKFRAWDGKKMHYNFLVAGAQYCDVLTILQLVAEAQYCDVLTILQDENFAKKEYKVKEWKVMQYTGLKDNTKWEQLTSKEQEDWLQKGKTREEWNGKEIYEGDVVRGGIHTELDYEIKWSDGGFIMGEEDALTEDNIKRWNLKVIGNLYENPELMEEEK